MSDNKACCFAGHRQVFDYRIAEKAETVIAELAKNGIEIFYTGGMGDFDNSCSSIVRALKRTNKNIKLYLVIPYLTQELNNYKDYYEESYDDIICPLDLMGVHYKGAIKKRNRWMVDNSAYIVAYVNCEWGGAYEAMHYAEKSGKHVVNLYEV